MRASGTMRRDHGVHEEQILRFLAPTAESSIFILGWGRFRPGRGPLIEHEMHPLCSSPSANLHTFSCAIRRSRIKKGADPTILPLYFC